MYWRLVCCNFLGTNGHYETRICPRVVYAQSGAWRRGQFCPGWCWTDEYAPGSVHHVGNLYAQYAKYANSSNCLHIVHILHIKHILNCL